MKSLETKKSSWLIEQATRFGRKIDRAITLGVAAAYPLLFSMDVPDPIPDWKDGVRFGWKVVRVTARETFKIIRKGLP